MQIAEMGLQHVMLLSSCVLVGKKLSMREVVLLVGNVQINRAHRFVCRYCHGNENQRDKDVCTPLARHTSF